MTMQITDQGVVVIKTKKDAVEALEAAHTLQTEIDELKQESGIAEMEKDLVGFKAAIRDFMKAKDIEQIQGDGYHGTLVKSAGTSRWITDDDDLTGDEADRIETLQSCIERKFGESITKKGSKARKVWMKITRRVADPAAIEEAVNEKVLDVDDISPAWVETQRAPYLRIFNDG